MEDVTGQARAAVLRRDGTRLPPPLDDFVEFTDKR
jgi:hypothetical protein